MKKGCFVYFLSIMFLLVVSGFISCKVNPDSDGKFAVNITAKGPGSVKIKDINGNTLSSGYRAQKGEKVLFYAKEDSGAYIEEWLGLDKPVKRKKSLSVNVERDLNITVVFKEGVLEVYKVDFTAESGEGLVRGFVVNGSVEEEVASPYQAVKGEKLIFRAEPAEYWFVNATSDWRGGADLQVKPSSNNLEAELIVKKATSVKVKFSVETVSLTFNADEDNGSVHARIKNEVRQPGVLQIPRGSEVTFIASPKQNYSAVFAGAKRTKPNEAVLRAEQNSTVTVSFDTLVDVKIFNIQNGVEFPKGMNDSVDGSLSKSFRIDKFPVTYDLWYKVRKFAEQRGYRFGLYYGLGGYVGDGRFGVPPRDIGKPPTEVNKKHPVTVIDWTAALVWCNAYSEMAGLEPVYYKDSTFSEPVRQTGENLTYAANECVVKEDANGYRMLTGDEWEFAARLTLNTANAVPDGKGDFFYVNVNNNKYYFTKGDSACGATKDYTDKDATQNVAHVYSGWPDPRKGETIATGTKAPSSLGLYDMTGNAQTWVFDNPSPSYFQPMPGGPDKPLYYRCLRGVAFGAPPPDAVDVYNKPVEESKAVCIGYLKAYFGIWMGGGFGTGLRVGRNIDD